MITRSAGFYFRITISSKAGYACLLRISSLARTPPNSARHQRPPRQTLIATGRALTEVSHMTRNAGSISASSARSPRLMVVCRHHVRPGDNLRRHAGAADPHRVEVALLLATDSATSDTHDLSDTREALAATRRQRRWPAAQAFGIQTSSSWASHGELVADLALRAEVAGAYLALAAGTRISPSTRTGRQAHPEPTRPGAPPWMPTCPPRWSSITRAVGRWRQGRRRQAVLLLGAAAARARSREHLGSMGPEGRRHALSCQPVRPARRGAGVARRVEPGNGQVLRAGIRRGVSPDEGVVKRGT